MKQFVRVFSTCFLVFVLGVVLCSFFLRPAGSKPSYNFPWKKAGLTERQAAAHLLSRFTYGATPGDIDRVVQKGLEKWFDEQLDAKLADDTLSQLLSEYDALKLSNEEVANTFPRNGQLVRMAVKDGFVNKDSVNNGNNKEYRDQLQAYMNSKGYRPQQDLYRQFINAKILRAAYTNNQLQEVLTDFWFNHFNVSFTKNDCALYIPAYERDAIRPHVLGNFETILLATAKSPAMLYYLDNFTSTGDNNNKPANPKAAAAAEKRMAARMEMMESDTSMAMQAQKKKQLANKARGLNENYAREVMELHTLGVDGGYTQKDVTDAAKVLTGWTIYPYGEYGEGARKQLERLGPDKMDKQGFVHEGDFLFAANRHDKNSKTVLGKTFKADGGYEEGVELLDMLAHHPSTAKFISKKLAVRFVKDDPSPALVDRMSKVFLAKDGNIRDVMIAMVTAPEFWNKEALREKTKSPFELAISSVRTLNASISQPYQLFVWINKMGQKMYYYQAPTGFPDNGKYWINTGSLLNRMNFGLALASNRIPGVKVDLYALNDHHEPESSEAALETFGKMIMPERDLEASIKRLTPLLNDPELEKKVDEAAGKSTASKQNMMHTNDDAKLDDAGGNDAMDMRKQKGGRKNAMQTANGKSTMLSQVVGIIVGSPEFQRK